MTLAVVGALRRRREGHFTLVCELPDCDSLMPDGHSRAVPPLPIPNRTVKRLCADDSAETGVKVGYRQAINNKTPVLTDWVFLLPGIPLLANRIKKGSVHILLPPVGLFC